MLPRPRLERRIEAADGTSIAYRVFADSGVSTRDMGALPTVVLSNGMGCRDMFFRHVLAALQRTHRVVAWDYRAHGDSGCARSGEYAIATQADDLARVVIDAMGTAAPPPAHVGFSMGVQVLVALARRRPELVRALALVSGAAAAPLSARFPLSMPGCLTAVLRGIRAIRPAVPRLAPLTRAGFRSGVAYSAGRALGLLMPGAPRAEVEAYLRAMTDIDPLAMWDTLDAIMSFDERAALSEISAPVLVIAGGRDIFIPRREIEAMHRAIPDAECAILDEAGHASLLEAGPRIAELVTAFLGRLGDERRRARPGRRLRARSTARTGQLAADRVGE